MAKDKPAKLKNMRDLVDEHQENTGLAAPEVNDDEFIFDEEFNNRLLDYNKEIENLDSRYTDLRPLNKIIVRSYVKNLKDENGLIQPNTAPIVIPTRSGVGALQLLDNPWPYSKRAIIVSIPSWEQELKVGMTIQLNNAPVRAMNRGSDYGLAMPNGFQHYEYEDIEPPKDPEHEDYGYLLVDRTEIEVILTTPEEQP